MVANTAERSETLEDDGIVIIEDYLPPETCDALYEEISEEIENGDFDRVDGAEHEYSYRDFVNWGGPVAIERRGSDEGMIDVFNVDDVVPKVGDVKTDDLVNDVINRAASEQYTPDNVNVYWNRSVTSTRGFHADSYGAQFKSFVYLTDVPDQSYGPFSYIRGSHRNSKAIILASKVINKLSGNPTTDALFYDNDDVVYCTAPKGTLIIANQSGYHRGYPQEEGRERMVITTSFTPVKQP